MLASPSSTQHLLGTAQCGTVQRPARGGERLKLLLMGRAQAGKTSMRSIIFAEYQARDTRRLNSTNQVEHSHLRLLGSLLLSLWDCGGQDMFMENYFDSQRETIFSNVHILVYVIEGRNLPVDKERSQGSLAALPNLGATEAAGGRAPYACTAQRTVARNCQKDYKSFQMTMRSLEALSPDAKVFVLIHKSDLLDAQTKDAIFDVYKRDLERLAPPGLNLQYFLTSIWSESLYCAWSAIIVSVLPDRAGLDSRLAAFCEVAEVDEILLFERTTFLMIGRASSVPHADERRFEKLSNICKQLRLACAKNRANFTSFALRLGARFVFGERFTASTYVIVVTSEDPEVTAASVLCNMDAARAAFEPLTEIARVPLEGA